MGTILLVVLVLTILLGALPHGLTAARMGLLPSGGLGLVVIIVLVLVLMGGPENARLILLHTANQSRDGRPATTFVIIVRKVCRAPRLEQSKPHLRVCFQIARFHPTVADRLGSHGTFWCRRLFLG